MLTRAIVPRRLDRSGVTMGVTAGVEQNGTQTEGGCTNNSGGGVPHHASFFPCRCSGFSS